MNKFSSPAIRIFNSENAESLIQRKPENNILSRQPFLDKTINRKSPELNRLKSTTKKVEAQSPQNSPSLDLKFDDLFSFKEVCDSFSDISYSTQLDKQGVLNVMRNYCVLNMLTPPPSPTFDKVPNTQKVPRDLDPKYLENGFDEDVELVEDIELPVIELSF